MAQATPEQQAAAQLKHQQLLQSLSHLQELGRQQALGSPNRAYAGQGQARPALLLCSAQSTG